MRNAGRTRFTSLSALLLAFGGMFVILGFVPQTLFRCLSFKPPALSTISNWRQLDRSEERASTDDATGEKSTKHIRSGPKTVLLHTHTVFPSECSSEDCALLVGGTKEAAVITIDNSTISETGVFPRVILREDHFPIMAPIPPEVVSVTPVDVTVEVYCKRSCDKIAEGLVASVVSKNDALSYVRASTVRFIFLPIASSMGLICIALIVCVFLITGRQQFWFGVILIMHCVANGMAYFLFADVLYETLPIRYAAPVYLSLRNIGNLAFFALCLASLRLDGFAKRISRVGFVLASAGTCLFIGCAAYLAWSPRYILDMVRALDGIGADFGPLKFAALVTCLLGCLLSIRKANYVVPALVFTFLVAITAFDETVVFGYPYRSYVGKFHALVVGCVFLGIFLRRRTELSTERRMQAKSDEEMTVLARQVAHDIRSPLAALKMVSADDGMDEETHNIVEMAVNRLTGIAETLLVSSKKGLYQEDNTFEGCENREPISALSSIAVDLVAQKKVEFFQNSDLRLRLQGHLEARCACVVVNNVEIQRVLSNLINNAVEAMGHSGEVTVRLHEAKDIVTISIEDEGCGIPLEILQKLGTVGLTHQKKDGNGLGVAHAKHFIESIGGKFSIESTLGVGTSVTLSLPRYPTPTWFIDSIDLRQGQKVVIIDDDPTIHKMWDNRFLRLGAGAYVALTHIYTATQIPTEPLAADLYLVDYHLSGFGMNGIELIQKANILPQAVLTTSAAQEPVVQDRCSELGLKLLAKQHAGKIDIRVS